MAPFGATGDAWAANRAVVRVRLGVLRTSACERGTATSAFDPEVVPGAGRYAVGTVGGELFAVTRRSRHLGADLANGSVDRAGCLVCPWHGAKYDPRRCYRADDARPAGLLREDPRFRYGLPSDDEGAATWSRFARRARNHRGRPLGPEGGTMPVALTRSWRRPPRRRVTSKPTGRLTCPGRRRPGVRGEACQGGEARQ